MFERLFKKKDSSQYEIRVALSRILGQKHATIPDLARDIAIDRGTLTKFLTEEKDVSFMTLVKIVDYIEYQNEMMGPGIKK